MMRVADVIAKELLTAGVKHVFMVTGGGAMHLNDAIGREKGLTPIFNHHEQACAIAAEAYTRLSGKIAAINVTTGPGGINALNGVHGAFTDSIAMIIISGQVKRETLARNHDPSLRQLGDQEVDIVEMVRPITKFATVLQDANSAREVLQKALYIAKEGRPGPVWIDIPIDIQAKLVDVSNLPTWNYDLLALAGDRELHPNVQINLTRSSIKKLTRSAQTIVARLQSAQRPLIMLGTGVRISQQEQAILNWAEHLNIPIVTAFNAHDLIEDNNPLYVGRPGTVGNRAGNFATQNCDALLVLGCRLNIRQISYNWQSFAKNAWIAQVDIDISELRKVTLHSNLMVHADLRTLMPILIEASKCWQKNVQHESFRMRGKKCLEKFPVVHSDYWKQNLVNPYCFIEKLFKKLGPEDVVVAANATATIASFQAGEIKAGLRLFSNSGSASMGYDLPAAIGATIAQKKILLTQGQVICLAGDGSIMMNLQELQTIQGYHLPIKIVLLNNNGYHSIRQSQKNHFPENNLGIDPPTGVSFPNFEAVALAFGYPVYSIEKHEELDTSLEKFLSEKGAAFCHVRINPQQDFSPKLASRRLENGEMLTPELDDMAPFLSRDELEINRTP